MSLPDRGGGEVSSGDRLRHVLRGVTAAFQHQRHQAKRGGVRRWRSSLVLLPEDEVLLHRHDEVHELGARLLELLAQLLAEKLSATSLMAARAYIPSRSWTRSQADGVPAYVVFHDRTPVEIAELQPRDCADLAATSGVGPTKLERYADEVLAVITAG